MFYTKVQHDNANTMIQKNSKLSKYYQNIIRLSYLTVLFSNWPSNQQLFKRRYAEILEVIQQLLLVFANIPNPNLGNGLIKLC